MKTYSNLWQEVTSFQNLHTAYTKAKKGKSRSSDFLQWFYNLENDLIELQAELNKKTYKTGKYRVFTVYEPKKRTIKAVGFKDRIVHHALCGIIEPIFESRFIYDSFACRKGKGNHEALRRLKKAVQSNCIKSVSKVHEQKPVYFLKCDVKKYFPNIGHHILKNIISKRITDKNVIWLLSEIIESSHSEFGQNKGVPIGNLTSQLFSNIYMNEFDQFVKHSLKIKHYFRYVDDFIILSTGKRTLHQYISNINQFMSKLRISIPKHKRNIFKTSDGVDFVGYRVYERKIKLRKSNIIKFQKRITKLRESDANVTTEGNKLQVNMAIDSFCAYAKHADARAITRELITIP